MSPEEILRIRLTQQHIAHPRFRKPADVLAWLGGMQAQDYGQSKWALGLRLRGADDADIEAALARGSIVRGWFMRGTLHLVSAADARWLLTLLAPRIVAKAAGRNRQLGLDAKTFARCARALEKRLSGGGAATRAELTDILERAGVQASGVRLSHVIQRLAVEGLLCLGPRRGADPTHVLFDEWVRPAPALPREEALGRLVRAYFRSRGPATLRDFAWWSGLTLAEAKAGLGAAGRGFAEETCGGRTYRRIDPLPRPRKSPSAHLLAGFDEYILGYADRSLHLAAAHARRLVGENGIFRPVVVVDGKVCGTWSRAFKKDRVAVELAPFVPIAKAARAELDAAARRYAMFAGRTLGKEPSDED